MKSLLAFFTFLIPLLTYSQDISSKMVLENAIKYHDPNGHWEDFNNTFTVVMTSPKSSKRTSIISINIPKEYFSVTATKEDVTTTYTLDQGKCQMRYNGQILDSLSAKEKNMTCDRATLYKNYYSYLYGLPMKLKDPGTNISHKVETKTFKGQTYLVLKVTYDKAIGNDIWYFYFNPETYALGCYQFFKTDENGNEKPDSGEYILLDNETLINGIKMPKIRAWYYNKDDAYLGTDTLIED